MVRVREVLPFSIAAKSGIKSGDYIISIDGNDIRDVLDYRFYLTGKRIVLKIHREAELFDICITKGEYDDIGLEFDTFLMDEKRSCKNGCIFCFIDQLPKGMRETLYFKDDDSRLSFLQGNYITLTNLSDEDIDRIVKMLMSPFNISVHTTDPELRVKMMKNKRAGEVLSYLDRLKHGRIQMNCQIVLCRGVNDGEHLLKTMKDLSKYYPYIESVSIVPSGLTKHRLGLYPLEAFDAQSCSDIIDTVEAFAAKCKAEYGSSIFFCADEMYIKAKRPLPSEEYYEGYPQIQNGVGMMRSMYEEFCFALEEAPDIEGPWHKISIATGEAAYEYMCSLTRLFAERYDGFECKVYKIRNDFFGPNITVAGLVVGRDLIKTLKGEELGKRLLIPAEMLRYEQDRFLDDTTVEDVQNALGVEVCISPSCGNTFFDLLCQASEQERSR